MAREPLRPCLVSTCKHVRPCPVHGNRHPRTRLYTGKGNWRVVARAYLAAHPFCVECKRHQRITLSAHVDHIRDHKGDERLFWNEANWQALCVSCHMRKSARHA